MTKVNIQRKISLNAEVDASTTIAMNAYTGGLSGELINENEQYGVVDNCTALVRVIGGTVKWINNQTYSHAYTGGISAVVNSVTCSDISVSGTVEGGNEKEAEATYAQMINYATGGGFGYIASTSATAGTDISGCNVRATVAAATLQTAGVWGNDTGAFAGLSAIPEAELKAKDNTASATPGFIGKNAAEPQGGINN